MLYSHAADIHKNRIEATILTIAFYNFMHFMVQTKSIIQLPMSTANNNLYSDIFLEKTNEKNVSHSTKYILKMFITVLENGCKMNIQF